MNLRGLLDGEETQKLRRALEREDGIVRHAYELGDGSSRKVRVRNVRT